MRLVSTMLCIALSITSCDQYRSETSELKERVSELEKKVDSLQNEIILISETKPKIETKKKVSRKNQTVKKDPEIITLKSPDNQAAQPATIEDNQSLTPKSSSYSSPSNNSNATSNQCMGTTKKGARCRRTVRGANYCWQH